MIIKELSFLILCFLIQLINVAAGDANENDEPADPVLDLLKKMPATSKPNLVDNILWICTTQQLSTVLIDFEKTEPNDEEFLAIEKLVVKLWRTLDGKVHRDEFYRYLNVYQNVKDKVSISSSELSSFVPYLVGNSPSETIMSCVFAKYQNKSDCLQDEVLSYKTACSKIIDMFTTDNLVEWMWNKLKEIKGNVTFENSSLILTQYRMISDVITPSPINEKTKIDDDDQTEKKEAELGTILIAHGCDLFSQYLKDTLRIYNDFASAVEEVNISDMKEKTENIDFMAGVLQEFTNIMILVNWFRSLSSDCLEAVTLNQAIGAIWRINEKLRTIFAKFIKDFGGVNPESLEQDDVINGNTVLKYIVKGKPEVNTDNLDKTYKFEGSAINYDTYYINDQKFFAQDTTCAQHYPIKFTDKIKKIISLRSVLSFYTKSLFDLKYKSIPIAVQLDEKNRLSDVVPEYIEYV